MMFTLMLSGKKKEEIVILGIDPGLADTGYGVIKKKKNELITVTFGSIKTARQLALAERLEELETKLNQLIKKYRPQLIAVEELFFCKNVKTALVVGQARGVILLAAKKNQLPIIEATPLQVKQGVTGYGQAGKSQVQKMVKAILKLKELPQPDDAADALALAIYAASNNSYYQN